jgi:acetoin:2,6-dichlorophenolindophenol oxidoreductase subunit alpha
VTVAEHGQSPPPEAAGAVPAGAPGSTGPVADASTRVQWLRRMHLIREFEELVMRLYERGLVHGTTHLCQGQEAVSVGVSSALNPDDYTSITYRGHGTALARGVAPAAAFAELMGRTLGTSQGLAGSMHLIDYDKGLLNSSGIVGGSLPTVLGAAMSAKLDGDGRVAVAFFGEGATNIGTFHEVLNMAAVWSAPALFVCENNLYGEYSPMRTTTPIEDIALRASSYAIPGEIVDGNDVEAVHAVTAAAVARARAGDGPTLIECKTYRQRGHSRSDPAAYRPPGELERWKERDPLHIHGRRLVEEGVLSEEACARIAGEAKAEVEAAAREAEASPWPTVMDLAEYADEPIDPEDAR